MTEPVEPSKTPAVDLAQVERLVASIEADLAQARGGSANVEALRREVDALKQLLDTNAQPAPVHDRLRSLHTLLDELVDDALQGARYVAEIGRMLGM
jgi:hypothetical protein